MKQVMYRWFWAWNYDREEEWLNEWARRGLALVDVAGFRYVFEESAPGEYEYRLELLENMGCSAESRNYLRFLEEMGIECIATYGRWVYLRRRTDGAPFDLFSDIDSKIKHLKRIDTLLLAVLVIQLAGPASFFLARDRFFEMLPIAVAWLVVAILVASGFVRIARKLRRLKRERAVRE